MLINVQAVSAARLTVFSCAGNCLADLEWKQPIIEEMQVMQHSTVPVLELTWIEMPQYIIINKQFNPPIMHGRLTKKKKKTAVAST